jgi:hypothetical protein
MPDLMSLLAWQTTSGRRLGMPIAVRSSPSSRGAERRHRLGSDKSEAEASASDAIATGAVTFAQLAKAPEVARADDVIRSPKAAWAINDSAIAPPSR